MVQGWYKHGTSVHPKSVLFLCTASPFSRQCHHNNITQIPVSFHYENIILIPIVTLARHASRPPPSSQDAYPTCHFPPPSLVYLDVPEWLPTHRLTSWKLGEPPG